MSNSLGTNGNLICGTCSSCNVLKPSHGFGEQLSSGAHQLAGSGRAAECLPTARFVEKKWKSDCP